MARARKARSALSHPRARARSPAIEYGKFRFYFIIALTWPRGVASIWLSHLKLNYRFDGDRPMPEPVQLSTPDMTVEKRTSRSWMKDAFIFTNLCFLILVDGSVVK